jgi:tetrahydromethanopterin S-methyltransferase subunit G
MDLRKKNLILTGVIVAIVIGLYIFSIYKAISSSSPP